jgi:predicted enzyme related to lactoylglutathione lyase
MHGQFVWYELTTPDVDAAKKFYPAFTGWGTQQFDKDYAMWTTGGAPFAGIFRLAAEQRQRGIPPNWMPYVETSNVDDTAKLAAVLGGSVMHGPEDIPNTGRFAVLQDPQGATFGIYKSNGPSRSWDGTAVVGRFSWHELMTTDYQKAFDFYRRLFGWEQVGDAMDMGAGNKYFMYGNRGKMYGGMFNRMADMASMRPFWMCYIHVKDVPKAVEIATRSGGALHRGPMDIPGGVIAILGDPQGAGFALHHMGAPLSVAKPAAKQAAQPAAKQGSKTAARPKSKSAAKSSAKRKAAAKKSPAAKKKSAAKQSRAKKSTRKSAAKRK